MGVIDVYTQLFCKKLMHTGDGMSFWPPYFISETNDQILIKFGIERYCTKSSQMKFPAVTACNVCIFGFSQKWSSCSPSDDLSAYNIFHGPTLTGANFASSSEVWKPTIL